jgi:hypothetical protein
MAFTMCSLFLGACASPTKHVRADHDRWAIDTRLALVYSHTQSFNQVCLQASKYFSMSRGGISDARRDEFEASINRYRIEIVDPLSRWWLNRSVLMAGNQGAEVRRDKAWSFQSSITPERFFDSFDEDFNTHLSRHRSDEDRITSLLFPPATH